MREEVRLSASNPNLKRGEELIDMATEYKKSEERRKEAELRSTFFEIKFIGKNRDKIIQKALQKRGPINWYLDADTQKIVIWDPSELNQQHADVAPQA